MSFLQHFGEMPDPRSHINRSSELPNILFLTVCAVLCGAEGWRDIEKCGHKKLAWLRKLRRFEQDFPVDDTILRIIRALDPERMAHCFINWVNAIRRQQGHQVIPTDGKTLRNSYQTEPKDAMHAITAWLREQFLVFCQMESAGKKKETQSVQALIEMLEIAHATRTLDATQCQKRTAKLIRKRKTQDVVYREDDSRIRRSHGAFNAGLVRRLCMNLVRLYPAKGSVRGKLKDVAWDDDFREQLLLGIND